jgi:hypothetical protein
MKAEEAIEKWRTQPDYRLSPEEVISMGRAEFRRCLVMLYENKAAREKLVDWLMRMYEPYFLESPEELLLYAMRHVMGIIR